MDAVQFGRWIADRRYARGWASQQALVEAVATASAPRDAGISRPFLARLEAGLLVHPFRGAARERVITLAAFLCGTPRQVQRYLQAAEITELGPEETAQVERILARLKGRATPVPLLPPARPKRLVGRAEALEEVLARIEAMPSGCYAITGMPGIGKTALAAECLNRIAGRHAHAIGAFPDGIATFTCTGRRGASGLLSLLDEILATFAPQTATGTSTRSARDAAQTLPSPFNDWGGDEADAAQRAAPEAALATSVNRARTALAGKRVLLLLDDVESGFPLRRALSVLCDGSRGAGDGTPAPALGQVVLVTSRTMPLPALVEYHLHLAPLEPDAAMALLRALMAAPLRAEDEPAARRLCAAVGNLPLGIEVLASVVESRGVPLAWLADQTEHSLRTLLDEAEMEMRQSLESAVAAAPAEARRQFALLSVLDAPVFDLGAASALHDAATGQGPSLPAPVPAVRNSATMLVLPAAPRPLALAETAATMNHLVRHSVVEVMPESASAAMSGMPAGENSRSGQNVSAARTASTRYTINPLFAALAQDHGSGLAPEVIERAGENLSEYAVAYVCRSRWDVRALEPMGPLLLSVTHRAIQRGDDDRVVRLMSGLTMLIMRLPEERMGERLFIQGIGAAKRGDDFEHAAHFLNGLGNFRYYHGHIQRAERTWHASIEAAEANGQPGYPWVALYNLNLLARMRGDYVTATRFADQYYRSGVEADFPVAVASGLLQRGISARHLGKLDAAYEDQVEAVRLLIAAGARDKPGITRMLLLEAEAELARLTHRYERSMQRMEEGIATAFETYDRYAAVELLLDQIEFAAGQGAHEDAVALARRAHEHSRRLGAPFFERRSADMLRALLRAPDHAPHSA